MITQEAKDLVLAERLIAMHEGDEVKSVYVPFRTLGAEMIAKLPSMDGSILVLSDAGLLVAVIRRLKVEGRDHSNVQFVCHTEALQELGRVLGVKTILISYNQINEWIAKANMGMKFDIVVGNPPYQGVDGSSDKLWKPFVTMMSDALVEGGLLAFVTPSSWSKPLTTNPSKLNQQINSILFNNSMLYLNINTSRYFNVGVQTSAWIIKKDSQSRGINWQTNNPALQTFAEKILGEPDQALFLDADKTVWKRLPDSKVKSDTHTVPVLGKNRVTFSNVDDVILRQTPKVIIPRVLGYAPQFDFKGEYGFNFNSHAVLCKSTEEVEAAKSILTSKIVRWSLKHLSWTPQTDFSMLKMMRLPSLKVSMSDAELYAHFDLDQAEIDLIEKGVK